jgi:hypothetical protein
VSPFNFWPNPKAKADFAELEKLGLKPQSWHGRRLRVVVEGERDSLTFWLEGLLVHETRRPAGMKGPIALHLATGDRLHRAEVTPLVRSPIYLPIDLTSLANDKVGGGVSKSAYKVGLIPFELALGERNAVSLRQAGWPEVKKDPSSYYEHYDGGPVIHNDPRMPYLRVPKADYAAMHVLAVADDDPETTNAFTVQMGRYGFASQVVQYDFAVAVPRPGDATKKAKPLETPLGKLFHVRVPITEAFAQDLDRFIEITLTKEIRLARRQPDPCRFRYRPLGLPSGVRIVAITLERSPIQFRVASSFPGHAFERPGVPRFQVFPHNITAADQRYLIELKAKAFDGSIVRAQASDIVEAGKSLAVEVSLPDAKLGYHDLEVGLYPVGPKVTKVAGPPLLVRRTSFALLPADTRKHRDKSPFGTWDFGGGHYTCDDPDVVGPLYVKLGLRFGMFPFSEEARRKYGIANGAEPVITAGGLATYEKYREKSPSAPPVALLFHEHAISGPHVSRIPDLFHDRPPYKLSDDEKKRFDKMWEEATTSAKALREKHPEAHIRLGNGTLPLREEFYRHKFPAELFDSAGNETGTFGRPPESQPPDCIANNASVWMDRQMLDAYGYKGKAVSQCYEVCYPACNPGNVPLRTQADYLVRHSLHALAWGIKEIRPGCISDMGNSYYYSNWGATGFCNKKPELNVKPSFVAFATMTRVLDGATFVRDLAIGSPSLYGMEFDLPDGSHAYPLWTMHGQRPLKVRVEGDGWRVVDSQANETELTTTKGALDVKVSASPVYLVGKGKVLDVAAANPVYAKQFTKPAVLASLTTLDDWSVEPGRNAELEYYNMMTPRRKGEFAFTTVPKWDGENGALKIAPQPIKHGKATMPMYAVLAHKNGIPVPSTPTEIGAWVHGNSGWGRLIFELTDASGQRWISLGAQQRGEPTRWMADWLPKEELEKVTAAGMSDWNTEDVFGLSRIDFDGWRYLAFPLPGNYPGEKYPWPANSQWRWDKDGVVHYPLTFRKLIVELPEKVLHVRTFEPPPRPEIYLRELSVNQGDVVRLKRTPYEERD